MSNRLVIISLTAGALAITGCQSNPTAPSENNVIMPLAIGNMWQYQTNLFDASGMVTNSNFDTTLIQSTSQIDGKTFDFIKHFSPPNLPSSTGYANKTDGLWVHQEGEAMLPYTILFFPFPIAVNAVKW